MSIASVDGCILDWSEFGHENALRQFELIAMPPLAVPAGFEPATPRFEVSCSIQLSYGTMLMRQEVEGAI